MTVITVAVTDPGDEVQRWSVPDDSVLNHTPIPRGVRKYVGSNGIAALGAGDETSVIITFTFPTAFVYLLKAMTYEFFSDDLTSEFNDRGLFQYLPAGVTSTVATKTYNLVSPGAGISAAVNSVNAWAMGTGFNRLWIDGTKLDTVRAMFADMSGDTSTAGNFAWYAEFWEYDIEQCFKWPVNTPQPIVAF